MRTKIGIIKIPDNSLVYEEENKFKTNRFILEQIIDDENDILELYKLSRESGCHRMNRLVVIHSHNWSIRSIKMG